MDDAIMTLHIGRQDVNQGDPKGEVINSHIYGGEDILPVGRMQISL